MTSKMKSTKIAPVEVKPPGIAPMSDSSLISSLVPIALSADAASWDNDIIFRRRSYELVSSLLLVNMGFQDAQTFRQMILELT